MQSVSIVESIEFQLFALSRSCQFKISSLVRFWYLTYRPDKLCQFLWLRASTLSSTVVIYPAVYPLHMPLSCQKMWDEVNYQRFQTVKFRTLNFGQENGDWRYSTKRYAWNLGFKFFKKCFLSLNSSDCTYGLSISSFETRRHKIKLNKARQKFFSTKGRPRCSWFTRQCYQ